MYQLRKHQKHNLVMGLKWEELVLHESHAVELAKILKANDAKYGVERMMSDLRKRENERDMLGLVIGEKPAAAKGAFSAALLMAQASSADYLWVEQVKDGYYWVVAFRNRSVDERTDRLLREDQVHEFINELIDSDQEYKLDPYSVMIDESNVERSISRHFRMAEATHFENRIGGPEYFTDDRYQVKALKGMSKQAVLALVGLPFILAMTVAGYWWYTDYQLELEAERARAALEKEKLIEPINKDADVRETRILEAVSRSLRADTVMVPGDDLIPACIGYFYSIPRTAGGWSLQSIDCASQGTAIANYVRDNGIGTNLTLKEQFENAFFPGNVDIGAVPFTFDAILGDPLKLDEIPLRTDYFDAWVVPMQMARNLNPSFNYNITAATTKSIQYLDPEKERLGQTGANALADVPPQFLYKEGRFILNGSSIASLEHFDFYEKNIKVANLVMTFSSDSLSWQMSGTYYER